MSYTLKHFLESNIIPSFQLFTGPQDFSKIIIHGISVQEIPLENFIQEGELVLSTALGCDKDPDRILQLVQGAAKAKAAAILFSFKDPVPRIPHTALDYAKKVMLPLLEIPWECRFSGIQGAVLSAIQEDKLSTYKHLQNTLFNQFFNGRSLEDAANSIAYTFKCFARIKDESGKVYGTGGTLNENDVSELIQIDIVLSGTRFGTLEIFAFEEIHPERQVLLRQYLAFPLSLWFNKKNIEDLTTARLKNDFVRNLASGNYDSFESMVQQGFRLHFDLTKPYTCIAMRAVLSNDGNDIPEYSKEIARCAASIETILLREGERRQLGVMVSNLSLEYTVFLENRGSSSSQEVIEYIEMVSQKIAKEYPLFLCFWGISETTSDTSDFTRLYNNATLTLRYCLNSKDSNRYLTYKDTRKAQIVSILAEHEEIQTSAREILCDLLAYDSSSNIGLFQTLTEFIHTSYNISQTARNLHIHRQSLLYRLEKIENLTGMSLNSHDDLFVLEVFSRIYSAY